MSERNDRAQGLTSDLQQEQWETVRWVAEALRMFASLLPLYPGTVRTEHGSNKYKTKTQGQPASLRFETLGQG